jgi:hypothetical protein
MKIKMKMTRNTTKRMANHLQRRRSNNSNNNSAETSNPPSAAVHKTIPVNSSGISQPDPIYFTDLIPRPPSHNLFLSHPAFISTLSFGTHTNTTAVSHISAHSEVR